MSHHCLPLLTMYRSRTALLLGLLALALGAGALPTPRQASRATGTQVATVLHTRVRELFHQYVRELLQGAALKGDHSLPTLPVLSGSAADLESVQAEVSLPAIQGSLRVYEAHLQWLRATKPVAHTPLSRRITEVLSLLQGLAGRVEDEMRKMGLEPRPAPGVSLPETKDWPTLRAGFVILRDLRIFLNKTAHELFALDPEW